MAELPYVKFYVADYLRDTEILSLSAQGGWMRMLCSMWHPSRRGVLSLRLQAMARLLGANEQTTKSIVREIEENGVADVTWTKDDDGEWVTITCRRMVRDWEIAAGDKHLLSESGKRGAEKRWGKHREANGPPIGPADSKAEGRVQKTKKERRGDAPRADVSSLPLDLRMKLEEIEVELGRLWPTAPTNMTSPERNALIDALPIFQEFEGEDWRATAAWIGANERQRGRKLWPRSRTEFVANVAEALDAIRKWWKKDGQAIFEPLLARASKGPIAPPPIQSPEEHAEMLAEIGKLKERIK